MSFNKGLVSVIIPCFNQSKFLAEALNSIISQSYSLWECIIVNDGSNDNTEDIAKQFVNKDSRIKYIYQENSGVSTARNTGFKVATGEFIQFLDGDDFIAQEKFNVQVEFLNKNSHLDINYCSFSHYYDNKRLFEKYAYEILKEYPLEDFLFGWDRNVGVPIHAPLFRRRIWTEDEVPFPPDYKYRYEDWVFWILICLKGCRFGYIEDTFAYYRIHETSFGSAINITPVHSIKAVMYIASIIPEKYKEQFLDETIAFYFNRYYSDRYNKEVLNSVRWKFTRLITAPFRYITPKFIKKRLKSRL